MKIPKLFGWPLFLGLSACASQPVDDASPGERPATDTDEAGLWQMLERDEYKLQTSTGVVRDPALQAYLESVLCRVVRDHCADIRLYVLPGGGMNAAMAPNGMMLVFTGLLVRLENEAQLAAVLGHEAAHYVKRHTLQRWRDLRARTATLHTLTVCNVPTSRPWPRLSRRASAWRGSVPSRLRRKAPTTGPFTEPPK
ncbi:MAG: M48 family metallopeptidase [Gammaproteobacteria bacterium]|nr:M48 family metallopeptidase [Gammaproteobacteria bacterium]